MTVPFVSCECFLTVVIVLTDLWVNATTHATHAGHVVVVLGNGVLLILVDPLVKKSVCVEDNSLEEKRVPCRSWS